MPPLANKQLHNERKNRWSPGSFAVVTAFVGAFVDGIFVVVVETVHVNVNTFINMCVMNENRALATNITPGKHCQNQQVSTHHTAQIEPTFTGTLTDTKP